MYILLHALLVIYVSMNWI